MTELSVEQLLYKLQSEPPSPSSSSRSSSSANQNSRTTFTPVLVRPAGATSPEVKSVVEERLLTDAIFVAVPDDASPEEAEDQVVAVVEGLKAAGVDVLMDVQVRGAGDACE
jgi:hypothetical protein